MYASLYLASTLQAPCKYVRLTVLQWPDIICSACRHSLTRHFPTCRYGAGLDSQGKQYRDPNVTLTNVYMASKHYLPGFNILDLYALLTYIGLVDTPLSTFTKLIGIVKGGANLKK